MVILRSAFSNQRRLASQQFFLYNLFQMVCQA